MQTVYILRSVKCCGLEEYSKKELKTLEKRKICEAKTGVNEDEDERFSKYN